MSSQVDTGFWKKHLPSHIGLNEKFSNNLQIEASILNRNDLPLNCDQMLSRALRTDLFGVSVRSLLKQNFSNGFLILLKLGIFHSKFYVFILSYCEIVFMVRLVSLDITNLGILFQVQLLEDCIQAIEFSFR